MALKQCNNYTARHRNHIAIVVFADAKARLIQPESLAVAVHHRLFNKALTLTSHTPVFCFAPVKSTSPLSDMLVNSLKMYILIISCGFNAPLPRYTHFS